MAEAAERTVPLRRPEEGVAEVVGSLAKLQVDSRGVLKVEIHIPLHQAAPNARELLESYGAMVKVILLGV